MTPERFEYLAGAYGADLSRWPEAERDLAEAFAAARPEQAKRLLSEAASVDALLASARVDAPSPAVFEQIVASGLRPVSATPRWAGMAAALALVFGAGMGWLGGALQTDDAETLVYASAFSVLEDDATLWEDGS